MKSLPPGPIGGYKKGGRPVKPRVLKEVAAADKPVRKAWEPHVNWKPFPRLIHVDGSKLESKKTVVLYAGRAARLRNRLRNHPLHKYMAENPDSSHEIWIWLSPDSTIQKTLESRQPDVKLPASEFRKAPDEPAVYVWVVKPRKVK